MKKKLESRLHVAVEPSKYIEYDIDNLFNAVIYFCYYNLKHIDPKNLPNIYIEIGSDCLNKVKDYSAMSTWDENTVLIGLSTQNIKEESDSEYCYESPIKILFHSFLHEFCHVYRLIESYLENDRDINYDKYVAQKNIELLKERKKLKRQGIDLDEVDLNMDEYEAAECFAFQNLSLLEYLYENDNLSKPQKASMSKVKKQRTKILAKPILKIVKNQNNTEIPQPNLF